MVTNLLGLILAGGEGSRAGGADKGLLIWQGQPLAARVAAALSSNCQGLIISCNRHLDEYRSITSKCFTDQLSNLPIPHHQASVQGPLAGIYTAWQHYPDSCFLISPCDTPKLSPLYAERMTEGLNSGSCDKITRIAWDGERKQYLHCLVGPAAFPLLRKYLISGQRNVRGWLDSMEPELTDFSDHPELFTNINTLEQLNDL